MSSSIKIINHCACFHVKLNVIGLLVIQSLRLMQVEMNENYKIIFTRLEESVLYVGIVDVYNCSSTRLESDSILEGFNRSYCLLSKMGSDSEVIHDDFLVFNWDQLLNFGILMILLSLFIFLLKLLDEFLDVFASLISILLISALECEFSNVYTIWAFVRWELHVLACILWARYR